MRRVPMLATLLAFATAVLAVSGETAAPAGPLELAPPPATRPDADAPLVALDNSAFDTRSWSDKNLEPLPAALVPAGTATNLDLVSRIMPGAPRSVASNGTHLFVGLGPTVGIFNLTDPQRPSLIATIDTTGFGYVQGMAVSGSYLYAACFTAGLRIYNISVPSAPTFVGSLAVAGNSNGIAVSGTTAYIAAGTAGLHVVNISTPASPSLTGTYNTTGTAYDVAVSATHAFVADGDSGLQIINIQAAPTLTATFDTPGSAYALVLSGSNVYIADESQGLRIVNVATPPTPTLTGSYNYGGSAYDIALSGSYAYLANAYQGLVVLNVSTPSSPTFTGVLDTPGFASAIALNGSAAYLADDGIVTINVSNPSAPAMTDSFPAMTSQRRMAVQGDLACVTGESPNGMSVALMDISNPAMPALLSSIPNMYGYDARFADRNLYVADWFYGLFIFDVTDPAAPVQLGNYNPAGWVYGISINDNYAYLAADTAGLLIVDISNPASPVLAGSYDTAGNARDVVHRGNYAYVADYAAGVHVINVSNPASPSLAGTYNTAGNAYGVAISGNILYVADVAGGLLLLDVSTPANPGYLNQFPAGANVQDVAVSDPYVYISDFITGLRILDASNPLSLTEVASYDADGYSTGVTTANGYAFLSDQIQGSFMVHYTNQVVDRYEPNNDRLTVAALPIGNVMESKIASSTDVDWYRFDLTGAGTLDAVLSPPPGKNYNLYLYNAAGTLLTWSINTGDALDEVTWGVAATGTYYLKVVGQSSSQYSTSDVYTLIPTFTTSGGGSCTLSPDEAVYIYTVTLDGNGKPVLHIQDPNQPEAVTGYNIYRSSSPTGPWTLRASNVVDMDAGTANIQYADLTGDVGGPWYYKANAYNGACSTEGP